MYKTSLKCFLKMQIPRLHPHRFPFRRWRKDLGLCIFNKHPSVLRKASEYWSPTELGLHSCSIPSLGEWFLASRLISLNLNFLIGKMGLYYLLPCGTVTAELEDGWRQYRQSPHSELGPWYRAQIPALPLSSCVTGASCFIALYFGFLGNV